MFSKVGHPRLHSIKLLDDQWLIGKDMEVVGIIWGIIAASFWRSWGKPQEISFTTPGPQAMIWTWDLPDTKQECYALNHDIRFLIIHFPRCHIVTWMYVDFNGLPDATSYIILQYISVMFYLIWEQEYIIINDTDH
jgi:hypothetical protein